MDVRGGHLDEHFVPFRNFLYYILVQSVCFWENYDLIYIWESNMISPIVVPTKSDSDVIFYLPLLSKEKTCTLHLS